MRLAAHRAGRRGISLRGGRLDDATVEALLTFGDAGTAVGLHGDGISPAMRRRVAGHPNVTDVLLEQLLSAPVPEVADNAAANSALRLSRMYRILTDAGL